MMRALHLNFLQSNRPPRWLGYALLAAGVLCGAAAGAEYFRLSAERSQLQTQHAESRKLLRREMPQLQRPLADPSLVAKELDQARLVLVSLARPWGAMFAELERVASPNVALLGIQPRSSGTLVRLRGEARRYEDLLEYITRLEETDRFHDVVLTAHEEQEKGGIRFALNAQWEQTP